jgi:DNA-binding HxlR family transcriptional regulator
MSNVKKMTKREMYEMIKANHNLSADEIAFIDHELELLAKKNSAEKKPTAVQVANEGIKADILDGMEIGKKYTITDLMKEIPACAELSNQRVSALVRQLVTDGAVERTEEKRKAYFSKVA